MLAHNPLSNAAQAACDANALTHRNIGEAVGLFIRHEHSYHKRPTVWRWIVRQEPGRIWPGALAARGRRGCPRDSTCWCRCTCQSSRCVGGRRACRCHSTNGRATCHNRRHHSDCKCTCRSEGAYRGCSRRSHSCRRSHRPNGGIVCHNLRQQGDGRRTCRSESACRGRRRRRAYGDHAGRSYSNPYLTEHGRGCHRWVTLERGKERRGRRRVPIGDARCGQQDAAVA